MELFINPVSETLRRNQEWLADNGESFLSHQRRVDQITAELLGLTYPEYIAKVSKGDRCDESRKQY